MRGAGRQDDAARGRGPRVTAVDSSESRLGRLRENLERTHLDAELVARRRAEVAAGRQFDAILLDAPCSATGTFRRHPEVLYRARPEDHRRQCAELQRSLLDRAADWLKPGGTLVYSVCSLEPQEGEEVIERLPRRATANSRSQAPAELPDFAPPAERGWVRILPGLLEAEGGLDGFFMARLVRRG